MLIISHPTSNANSRAVVNGLVQSGLLREFHTAIAAFPNSSLYRIGGVKPFSEIRRRGFENELKEFTYSSPKKEVGRLLTSKLGLKSFTQHEKGVFSVDAVYAHQDKKVAGRLKKFGNKRFDAVYAYEDGAYYSFKEAEKHEVTKLYDLPIGYWRSARKLLQAEIEQWPEWAATLTGFKDSEEKLKRKDKELAMANRIFVASSFTANSLKEYPGELAPIEVIPYGFPQAITSRKYHNHKKLKALFVGGLSQRKGVANMFAAVEKLKDNVSLTVVGRKTSNSCVALNAALKKHNWIPSLPHHEVLELMQQHDILLFPSLFEGFGMVITEAMSQGTPVITTERTAGPDLIDDGNNGLLINAGDTDALVEKLENLLSNRDQIETMGKAALETARLRPWKAYGNELSCAIKKSL